MKSETKVMKLYRLENNLYKKGIPILPKVICKIIRIFFGAEIPYTCKIGENVELKHGGLGIVIHDKAEIGDGSIIYHNVTIGGREQKGHPIIGKNVYIGTGACILGGITIGDNVKVGANAVVLKDLPSNSTAVGVPATINNKSTI